jgi:hypothetical protein
MKPTPGDLLAAVDAFAIGALFEPFERGLDTSRRLGLHLQHRQLEVVLVAGRRPIVIDGAARLVVVGTNAAQTTGHLLRELAVPPFEHGAKIGVPRAGAASGRPHLASHPNRRTRIPT